MASAVRGAGHQRGDEISGEVGGEEVEELERDRDEDRRWGGPRQGSVLGAGSKFEATDGFGPGVFEGVALLPGGDLFVGAEGLSE